MKKLFREYAFAVLVVLSAIALVLIVYNQKDNTTQYLPQEYDAPQESATTENEEIVIWKTELVYYHNNSKVFHIKPGCCGLDITLPGQPCGGALDLGLKPCQICMKNYKIVDVPSH